MIAGSHRGLDYNAMTRMTLGAIVDYCVEYDNQQTTAEKAQEKPKVRRATQAEIDAFFG